jgi:ATP-dependent protease ClpP protease subunit
MDIIKNGEIVLSGTVGLGLFEDGFTYLDVVEALATIGRNKDVTVRINSGGGIAAEGVAIFNAFDSHKGDVTIIVESIAASAASVIAMAGSTVVMSTGAVMMVHDPAAFTMGNSQDHTKSVEMLETMATSMADIYAEKTGRPAADIREEMKSEIWMTANEAVLKGYADETDKTKSIEPTAFDYRIYQHAPERMVALAKSRGWKHPGATAETAANPNRQHEEISMTDAEKAAADKLAAEKIVAETAVAAKAEAGKAIADKALAEKAAAEKVTAEGNVAEAVKVERQRAADIHAACQLVGKPEKSSAFISEGKTLSEVVTALQSDRVTASDEMTTRHTRPHTTEAPLAEWKSLQARVKAEMGIGRK